LANEQFLSILSKINQMLLNEAESRHVFAFNSIQDQRLRL